MAKFKLILSNNSEIQQRIDDIFSVIEQRENELQNELQRVEGDTQQEAITIIISALENYKNELHSVLADLRIDPTAQLDVLKEHRSYLPDLPEENPYIHLVNGSMDEIDEIITKSMSDHSMSNLFAPLLNLFKMADGSSSREDQTQSKTPDFTRGGDDDL